MPNIRLNVSFRLTGLILESNPKATRKAPIIIEVKIILSAVGSALVQAEGERLQLSFTWSYPNGHVIAIRPTTINM